MAAECKCLVHQLLLLCYPTPASNPPPLQTERPIFDPSPPCSIAVLLDHNSMLGAMLDGRYSGLIECPCTTRRQFDLEKLTIDGKAPEMAFGACRVSCPP